MINLASFHRCKYKAITVIFNINGLKDRNHMAIPTNAEKTFDNSRYFLIVNPYRNGSGTSVGIVLSF